MTLLIDIIYLTRNTPLWFRLYMILAVRETYISILLCLLLTAKESFIRPQLLFFSFLVIKHKMLHSFFGSWDQWSDASSHHRQLYSRLHFQGGMTVKSIFISSNLRLNVLTVQVLRDCKPMWPLNPRPLSVHHWKRATGQMLLLHWTEAHCCCEVYCKVFCCVFAKKT